MRAFAVRSVLVIPVFWLVTPASFAQDQRPWNTKQCAVCLTYDDALNVDLDRVVPALDSLGLRATFYVSGFFPSFKLRSVEWRAVAGKGHELGNHTLFHPCTGSLPGREWVKPDYDLNSYSIQRMVDEITMANVLLKAIDGKTKRTFAYPCGDTKVRDSSYVPNIKTDFVAARGVQGKMERIDAIDLYGIGSYMVNGQTGDELIALVRKAMESHTLVVFLFHGVGGEHSLNVSAEAHSQLLHFLKQNEASVWVAPLVEIADYVTDYDQRQR
jgi:sialate O-acetylesterase